MKKGEGLETENFQSQVCVCAASTNMTYAKSRAEMGLNMDNNQLPIGLSLSLAMNQRAMERFANMTEAEKEQAIAKSRGVKSKREMDRIVSSLAEDDDEELKSFFSGVK